MKKKEVTTLAGLALCAGLTATPALANDDPMAVGSNGYQVSKPVHTVGESFFGTTGALNPLTAGTYTPVGVMDGIGAFELDKKTVRVFVNHELGQDRGYAYEVLAAGGGTVSLTGARVSYFDIDKKSRTIVDAGLAYGRIHDANGQLVSDTSFLSNGFTGLSRLCSAGLFEAGTYNLADTIFFTGEEDGGNFNPIGGALWALDADHGALWQVPELGHGAWENVTALDAKKFKKDAFQQFPILNAIWNLFAAKKYVAIALSDDTSPFDADTPSNGEAEAAPMFLYVGAKHHFGDFVDRNGLGDGDLYVWVSKTGELSPLDFNGSGSLKGRWVEIDNDRKAALASNDGSTGYDQYGFPTQKNLWLQAEAVGAFQFSRPEDVATNPKNGTQFALASTGVDTFAVDPISGNGVDTFGTIYLFDTNFKTMNCELTIVYDGDADPARALRSPDNLDWADDGYLYVQEDKAETDTLTGEFLFGPTAVNTNEAGIVRVDVGSGATLRVANIDRSVVLDGSIANPENAVDTLSSVGDWETSGILDVSKLFGEKKGTLFLFDVQAHGIQDQDQFDATSRISDFDLVEGGQLLFLEKK
ncbi:MAG: DUF839 domain-containing protein [Planctomycetota bacterium]